MNKSRSVQSARLQTGQKELSKRVAKIKKNLNAINHKSTKNPLSSM